MNCYRLFYCTARRAVFVYQSGSINLFVNDTPCCLIDDYMCLHELCHRHCQSQLHSFGILKCLHKKCRTLLVRVARKVNENNSLINSRQKNEKINWNSVKEYQWIMWNPTWKGTIGLFSGQLTVHYQTDNWWQQQQSIDNCLFYWCSALAQSIHKLDFRREQMITIGLIDLKWALPCIACHLSDQKQSKCSTAANNLFDYDYDSN